MQKTFNVLTEEESILLLNMLSGGPFGGSPKWKAQRNNLFGLLMLDTGIRVGELVQLVKSDLFISGEAVKALKIRHEIAKRGHERIIPLSERCRLAIECYVSTCCMEWPSLYNGLTVRQVQRIIQAAGLKALGRKITPHTLRHTFASNLMRVTSIRVVQTLLGHKNLSSTQIYTHPNHQDCTEAIAKMHE